MLGGRRRGAPGTAAVDPALTSMDLALPHLDSALSCQIFFFGGGGAAGIGRAQWRDGARRRPSGSRGGGQAARVLAAGVVQAGVSTADLALQWPDRKGAAVKLTAPTALVLVTGAYGWRRREE